MVVPINLQSPNNIFVELIMHVTLPDRFLETLHYVHSFKLALLNLKLVLRP